MDASASAKVDDVYTFFLKIENTDFPTPLKQRSTVIKYTKLPEFDYDSKVSWPQNSYTLQPRLRRIITLEEPISDTTRSLKLVPCSQRSAIATNMSNRKIVTISEDDEYDLHPKFSNEAKKSSTSVTNQTVETESKKESVKQSSKRNTTRLTSSAKLAKESRCAAKTNNVYDKREATSRSTYKGKLSNQASLDNIRTRTVTEKETRKTKSASLSRTSLSKNLIRPSESEQGVSIIQAKLYESFTSKPSKKIVERARGISSPPSPIKSKALLIEMKKKRKLTPIIHVPLEDKGRKRSIIATGIPSRCDKPTITVYTKSDGSMDTEIIVHQDVSTGTEPPPGTAHNSTDMEGYEPQISYKCIESSDVQAELIQEAFDKLDIPNVSLKKDKVNLKEELFDLHSKSLPNLQIPPIKMTDNRKEKSMLDTHYSTSASYIISRATLTYKTQQKINYHVVDSKENAYSNQSPSPLKHPINVVSVFKDEMSSKDLKKDITVKNIHESKSSKKYKNCVNEIKSLNCSYVPNSNKLMKPSEIISTIRVNNGLLQSVLVCEQFQRELNFLDSFFESLQFLESCSQSGKHHKNEKIDNLVNDPLLSSELDGKNTDYDSFFSKLENGANSEDKTMVCKNIFLLNILIRDEQRRAKNLLSVLKRREDALKDFTKSQILYLENKKRQDNTDISALKKKQRGALLKLQHECGEMQRMRKALLALSEKRKVALMKTKKELELKLRDNADGEHILLGKKKLKRTPAVERTSAPLKCFDLSSSGCEDTTATSRDASDDVVSAPDEPAGEPITTPCVEHITKSVTTADKGIQTGDSNLSTALAESCTNTVEENFVAVDGGYLNILFHNLSLPQIFSHSKQYEVNQEALKDIVDSTNQRQGAVQNWNEVVERLVNQSRNDEEDKSSTPSTARSLVEEFEQYYKSMAEEDRLHEEEDRSSSPDKAYDADEAVVQTSLCKMKTYENKVCAETMTTDLEYVTTVDDSCGSELLEEAACSTMLAGPLPVPAGAPYDAEPIYFDGTACPTSKSSDTSCLESSASSQPLFEPLCEAPCDPPCEPVGEPQCDPPSELPCEACDLSPPLPLEPTHAEAEELRRQQLAIEREIKELEQQQSRLLVVREIPDKPPPPYTPPVEARSPRHPRPFRLDDVMQERIQSYVTEPAESACDPTDAFDVLVHDFCEETVQKYKLEQSDKPWDSCNLLPQKPPTEAEKLIETVTNELNEVLTPAAPSVVSGVSSRRSDHIDDILFAEWRRAEPEWTSLHTDEALVKNQIFETIFQRILTDTVDEYKRTVLSPPPPDPDSTLNL